MRRKIWYYLVRAHLGISIEVFFSKFEIIGRDNIAEKRPILFLPNHQNTFLDALCIAESQSRMTHYMARADVFKNPKLKWLMSTINLRPIYRIRDGKKAVQKNEKVFLMLQDFMNDGECVMIHPEATHNLEYRLRELKKGFARLAFGFLERYPDQNLDIVPVGINYSNHTDFRSEVSIHYGNAIDARTYFEREDQNQALLDLKDDVAEAMKKLVTHIQPVEEYQEKFDKLRAANNDFSYLARSQMNLQKVNAGESLKPQEKKKPTILEKALYPLVYLNNIFFALIWKKIKPRFKDSAWHGPVKLGIGVFLGPIVYSLQTLMVYLIFGPVWAFLYLFFTFVTIPILRLGQHNTRQA